MKPVKPTLLNTWKKRTRGYTTRNRVQLVHGCGEFFGTLKRLIAEAHDSIHLQTYIFNDDQTGTAIAEGLKAAVGRGVAVYVLADGYASKDLSPDFIRALTDAGVHFRFFEPIFMSKSFYFGRRLHHKVVVVDHRFALVSGTNIADRYDDLPGYPAWLDMALLVEGQAVGELYEICRKIWNKDLSKKIHLPRKQVLEYHDIPEDTCTVKVLQNDWVRRLQQIWRAYNRQFQNAGENITIMCSYFLPGKTFRTRLARATRRGVKVRVVLAGTSDVAISKHAERYLYRWMLRHGIEIYEYQPTVLHAKVAVIDGEWLTIGSYNVNDISTYASVELNLEVRNKELAQQALADIDTLIARDCIRIDPARHPIRLFSFRQLLQWSSYYLIRVVLNLSTFYFKQEE